MPQVVDRQFITEMKAKNAKIRKKKNHSKDELEYFLDLTWFVKGEYLTRLEKYGFITASKRPEIDDDSIGRFFSFKNADQYEKIRDVKKNAFISKVSSNRYLCAKLLKDEGCNVHEEVLTALRESCGTKGGKLLEDWVFDGEPYEGRH